jgi:hypothetical protein
MPTDNQPDSQDEDFIAKLHNLLGLDEDRVKTILDELSADNLMQLTDAVSQNNKEAVESVIGTLADETEESVNPLFRGKNLGDSEDKRKTTRTKSKNFAIGEEVEIDIGHDKHGKLKTIRATVINADQPGHTVLVRYEGKRKMVDRDKVHAIRELQEMVLGMTGMPNLQRIQRLAGITAPPPPSSPYAAAPELAVPSGGGSCNSPMEQATAALDDLEQSLPQVMLVDLKIIRQRLQCIQAKMNEDSQHRRRKV